MRPRISAYTRYEKYGQRAVAKQVAEASAYYAVGTKKGKKSQSMSEFDFDAAISKRLINYDVFIATA
jgi:hypothetical protein